MRRPPIRPARRTRLFTSILTAFLALAVATPGVAGAAAGFGDIEEGRYYTDAVAWMVGEEITTGIEDGCFGPDQRVTRGQVATFLHRLDDALGNAPSAIDHPFDDVTAGYQQAPVGWLYAEGLTTGISANTFGPKRAISRGDFAVLVWRYAGQPEPAASVPFVDVTATYQESAVAWMAESGITTGTSETTFTPNGLVTRAEAATFLFRFVDPQESPLVADDGNCTQELRTALELGGLTTTEAFCAVPSLAGFDVDYLLAVVEDRETASLDLILAAVAVAGQCLEPGRIADLSRLFL